jgi:hypothetical protein
VKLDGKAGVKLDGKAGETDSGVATLPVKPRPERSFAEALLDGSAVSPTAFLGERTRLAFERYRASMAAETARRARP